MTQNYRDRFSRPEQAEAYEKGQYDPRSYSSFIWDLQKPVLARILENCRKSCGDISLLDFACGTGRVLSFVERLAQQSTGVDISESMIRLAAEKCSSPVRVGDILSDSALLPGPFDIITVFRFLLNVEPEVRSAALLALGRRLKPNGLLIANIHGNAWSVRHLPIVIRRLARHFFTTEPSIMLEEMSPPAMRRLFANGGLSVVEEYGFGVVPPFLYRTPLRPFAAVVDRALAGRVLVRRIAIDVLIISQPSG